MSPSVASSVDIHDSINLVADLLDAVAAPVYAKSQDQRWLFANRACCKLLNTTLEQIVGCFDQDIVAVIDTELLRSQDTSFFSTKIITNQPIRINTSNGQRQFLGDRTLLQTAKELILINTLKDVSEITQIRAVNSTLQEQLEERDSALDQLTEFEATLKRITDRVRDSLDEKQILQTAVQEITDALNVRGSTTSLYEQANIGTRTRIDVGLLYI